MTLAEALENVELEPGTYRCTVNGRSVVVRVSPTVAEPGPITIDEDDVMLDPWCALPPPETKWKVRAKFAPLPLPNRIEIPPEGDKPA